jgi:NMD protein affecting ribosome stability and mRNA decay
MTDTCVHCGRRPAARSVSVSRQSRAYLEAENDASAVPDDLTLSLCSECAGQFEAATGALDRMEHFPDEEVTRWRRRVRGFLDDVSLEPSL